MRLYLFLILFILSLLFAFASCSMQEIEVPATFTDYEYRTGENKYIAFTHRHFYRVWYNRGDWRDDVSPNVQCVGTYTYQDKVLTLDYYETLGVQEYTVTQDGDTVRLSCGPDCMMTWTRTRLNNYIR